jgi:LysM repeat protein
MARLRYSFAVSILLALLVAVNPAGAAPPRQPSEPITHVVQPGENLFRISLRYNTTVAAIMAANNITNADTVYAGQELIIPTATQDSHPPEQPLQTTPAPADSVPIGEASYLVRWGDTLGTIAARHGTTLWALVEANGLSHPYVIYAGQRLIIPTATPHTPPQELEPTPSPSSDAPETYTIQPGDTLTQIARRFGTTTLELARLNRLTNPSAIYAGQVLHLTGSGTAVAGSKHVLVDVSEQHLYAYEGDQLVFSFIASTGAAPTYTRTGQFYVQSKIPSAYGATWDIWMPHWLGIYWAGGSENGIHALPILPSGQTLWAGYLGTPISYGCVVLGTYEAASLYEWAELGTAVTIQP